MVSIGCAPDATGIEGATGADVGSGPWAVARVVDLGRGIGKVEQRRVRRNVCLLHRRQRRIGDRSQRNEEGAGDGADAGSGTFICGRGDAWEEIWAIRNRPFRPGWERHWQPWHRNLGVGMVKICVE